MTSSGDQSLALGKARDFLQRHGLETLRIRAPFLNATLNLSSGDSDAAWELYVELLTRAATQPLHPDTGNEEKALESVYSLFPTTREILKRQGRHCETFTKIAIVVLNQRIRPFTTKWHKLSMEGELQEAAGQEQFRAELEGLQQFLRKYTRALAELAGVEDLTDLEDGDH